MTTSTSSRCASDANSIADPQFCTAARTMSLSFRIPSEQSLSANPFCDTAPSTTYMYIYVYILYIYISRTLSTHATHVTHATNATYELTLLTLLNLLTNLTLLTLLNLLNLLNILYIYIIQ